MKTSELKRLALLAAGLLPLCGHAQVNSGSDGHDGALNPTANLVIDMADHPDGIYHYTSVNIPAGVTVSFIPNAGNKPVVWLVQADCVVNGNISLNGQSAANSTGANAAPGGYKGGSATHRGEGPGGGPAGETTLGGNASFGSLGTSRTYTYNSNITATSQAGIGYGNIFLVPLLGGSGGGSASTGQNGWVPGGGGGGGAILIAASDRIVLNGTIVANGGYSWGYSGDVGLVYGGTESGGAIRLVSNTIVGTGSIEAVGPVGFSSDDHSGLGRVRLDCFQNNFGGSITGVFTQGFQPIILSAPSQGIQLAIQSVGGVAVAANPSGVLANPDVIVPAQQTNPVSIVVSCTNVALNSEVTVVVQPANGAAVQSVGLNHAGTAAASTATVSLNMPRGGGIIYAKAVTGLAGTASTGSGEAVRSLAQTGWTATGERFKAIEVTAALGGAQRIAYITESGKRYEVN